MKKLLSNRTKRSMISIDKIGYFLKRWYLSGLPILGLILFLTSSCKTTSSDNKLVLPEIEPKPYTVRYAPADGSISSIDPPAFVWLPVDNNEEYVLQYSRKADFKPDNTTTVNCKRTIFVPREVMGPGSWYWRYGCKDEKSDEIIYSKTRKFTILKDAAKVPFPDVKKVISDIQGVRPRDFVRDADIQRFRDLGKGALKSHIEEIKKSADRYIDQPLHPEPPFLSEDREQRIVDFVKIMRSTRAFNRGISACATAYLLTGEEKYGMEARRGILHLATWDPEGSTNLFHNDEPGHEIVRVMVNAYDWIYPLLSETDRKKICDVLAVRIPQIYKILIDKPFEIRPYESHAMDYYIGDLLEACICMADEIPVEEMLEYVLLQLWSPFFPPYGGDDGGWCEGPSYWQWSTATFLRNFTLVKQNCGVDLTKKSWLENTAYFKLYCNPPYSKMSPFGDGQSSRASSSSVMYKLGITFQNPYALWYDDQLGSKPGGVERFIYYTDQDDTGKPPVELPQARCFFNIGLACMHSDLANGENNVHFMLRSSPFGAISHAYADQNAFVLFAYGEPLAIASGYYPYYNSPHHRSWTWETKASNSLLVNGEGQKKRNWDSRGKIVNFKTTDYAHYALGDATEAYFGLVNRFFRHALFLRPVASGDEPVIILYDDVTSQSLSSFDWLLHSLEKMQVDEQNKTIIIRRGEAGLLVQFLTPESLRFYQSDKFTAPPEAENMPDQWHLNAQTVAPDSVARFVTVLMPFRNGFEEKLPRLKYIDKSGWVIIELTSNSTRQVVAFRTDAKAGTSIKIGEFRTKADIAATAFDLQGKVMASIEIKNTAP